MTRFDMDTAVSDAERVIGLSCLGDYCQICIRTRGIVFMSIGRALTRLIAGDERAELHFDLTEEDEWLIAPSRERFKANRDKWG